MSGLKRLNSLILIFSLVITLSSSKYANANSELLRAAERGDFAKVKALLWLPTRTVRNVIPGQKVDVNYEDRGLTPLSAAARAGHTEVVKILLSYGAHPTTPINPIYTVTQRGSSFHAVGTYKQIHKAHKTIDLFAYKWKAVAPAFDPLELAAAGGHLETAKILVAALQKAHSMTYYKETPLINALKAALDHDQVEMQKLLLSSSSEKLHESKILLSFKKQISTKYPNTENTFSSLERLLVDFRPTIGDMVLIFGNLQSVQKRADELKTKFNNEIARLKNPHLQRDYDSQGFAEAGLQLALLLPRPELIPLMLKLSTRPSLATLKLAVDHSDEKVLAQLLDQDHQRISSIDSSEQREIDERYFQRDVNAAFEYANSNREMRSSMLEPLLRNGAIPSTRDIRKLYSPSSFEGNAKDLSLLKLSPLFINKAFVRTFKSESVPEIFELLPLAIQHGLDPNYRLNEIDKKTLWMEILDSYLKNPEWVSRNEILQNGNHPKPRYHYISHKSASAKKLLDLVRGFLINGGDIYLEDSEGQSVLSRLRLVASLEVDDRGSEQESDPAFNFKDQLFNVILKEHSQELDRRIAEDFKPNVTRVSPVAKNSCFLYTSKPDSPMPVSDLPEIIRSFLIQPEGQ